MTQQATKPAPSNGSGAIAPATKSPLINLAQKFSIDPNRLLDVLKGTVIKPDKNGRAATNDEIAAFCIVADQYGLSPFTREIHAFVSNGAIVPIVGIDGWTHIVNACPNFDGCEFIDVEDEQGKPVSITCKMYVKGRSHAVSATERYSECKRGTIPWNTMPWRMLRHKAYMQAARYAFGLSGIYDEDEAKDQLKSVTANADPLPTSQSRIETALATTKQEAAPAADGEIIDAEVEPQADGENPPPPAEVSGATLAHLQELLSKLGLASNSFRAEIKIKKWQELSEQDALSHISELKKKLAAKQSQRDPGDEPPE